MVSIELELRRRGEAEAREITAEFEARGAALNETITQEFVARGEQIMAQVSGSDVQCLTVLDWRCSTKLGEGLLSKY